VSVDLLTEHHELWGYSDRDKQDWPTLEVEVGGTRRTVRYPEIRDGRIVNVVRADLSQDDTFLYVIGETAHDHDDYGKVAMLVGGYHTARLPNLTICLLSGVAANRNRTSPSPDRN
jgi:hypothetical protein